MTWLVAPNNFFIDKSCIINELFSILTKLLGDVIPKEKSFQKRRYYIWLQRQFVRRENATRPEMCIKKTNMVNLNYMT